MHSDIKTYNKDRVTKTIQCWHKIDNQTNGASTREFRERTTVKIP